MSSADYQLITTAPRRTAAHDLKAMVAKGLLILEGLCRGARHKFTKGLSVNAYEMRKMSQGGLIALPATMRDGNAPEMDNVATLPGVCVHGYTVRGQEWPRYWEAADEPP